MILLGRLRFRLLVSGDGASGAVTSLAAAGVPARLAIIVEEALGDSSAAHRAAPATGVRPAPVSAPSSSAAPAVALLAAPVPRYGFSSAVPSADVRQLHSRLKSGREADRVDRVLSAYAAGRQAAHEAVLGGLPGGRTAVVLATTIGAASNSLGWKYTRWIVLARSSGEAAFWTSDRAVFLEAVCPGGNWDLGVVAAALVTLTELLAVRAGTCELQFVPEWKSSGW